MTSEVIAAALQFSFLSGIPRRIFSASRVEVRSVRSSCQ